MAEGRKRGGSEQWCAGAAAGRRHVIDGETFTDLDDARQRAEHWCGEVAGRRVHGTTRKVLRELFESVEKAARLPPPA